MYLSQHVKELQSIYLLYSSEQTLDTWKWLFIVDFPIKNGDFP